MLSFYSQSERAKFGRRHLASTFVSVKAQLIGISPSLSFYTIAILNAATIVGRASCGIIAIRFGSLNTTFVITAFGVAFLYAWGFVNNHLPYFVVTCFYG
jgi:hypothetical protein